MKKLSRLIFKVVPVFLLFFSFVSFSCSHEIAVQDSEVGEGKVEQVETVSSRIVSHGGYVHGH